MSENKKCFVLMPFDEQYKEIYTDVYKSVCGENDIDCLRVDEIARPGSITRDIVEGILDSDIIIADLTSRNPNVFYELGIAHATGNKAIMTAQSMKDVPFDIANYRVIIYDQSISGAKALKLKLDQSIKELLKALDQTNNPLQDALSHRSSFGSKKKSPLVKYVDLGSLPKRMRDWLNDHGIIYADDVNKIDLEELVNTPGIGKGSLSPFFAQIVENDLFDDAEALQKVVTEKGLKLIRNSWGDWS